MTEYQPPPLDTFEPTAPLSGPEPPDEGPGTTPPPQTGTGGPITSAQITDATVLGRQLVTAESDVAGREFLSAAPASAIPALTSNLFVVAKDPTTGFWPSGWNRTTTPPTPVYTAGSVSAAVRPTASRAIHCLWSGADPLPTVVTSGTGGFLSGIDIRLGATTTGPLNPTGPSITVADNSDGTTVLTPVGATSIVDNGDGTALIALDPQSTTAIVDNGDGTATLFI